MGRTKANKKPAPPAAPIAESRLHIWFVACGLILVASLLYRLIALDRLPGISGDEAQLFVLLRDYLHGRAPAPEFMTPTHRPIPLWIATMAPWAGLVSSSPWVLRAPGALGGLLLVGAGAFAARRLFTRDSVACAVALAIACLPMHIAYSRMGWDASQTSLATLFPIYFLLRGAELAALLTFLLGLLVHPLVFFLAPLAGPALFLEWIPRRIKSKRLQGAVQAVAGVLCAVGSVYLFRHFVSGRPVAPGRPGWLGFVGFVGDIFSGASSYEYFVAKPQGGLQWLLRGLGFATLSLFAWSAWRTARNRKSAPRKRWFGLAGLAALAVFHVVSPYQENGTERYLLIFTVPVLFAIGLGLEEMPRWRQSHIMAVACAACVLHLGLFAEAYFLRPGRGQPYANPVYASGPEEPKAAAYQWIAARAQTGERPGQLPTIVTDGFWNYWVSRYFVGGDGIRVRYIPNSDAPMPRGDLLYTVSAFESAVQEQGFGLGFSDGSFTRLNTMLRQIEVCERRDFTAFGGKPVVSVWRYCPRQLSAR